VRSEQNGPPIQFRCHFLLISPLSFHRWLPFNISKLTSSLIRRYFLPKSIRRHPRRHLFFGSPPIRNCNLLFVPTQFPANHFLLLIRLIRASWRSGLASSSRQGRMVRWLPLHAKKHHHTGPFFPYSIPVTSQVSSFSSSGCRHFDCRQILLRIACKCKYCQRSFLRYSSIVSGQNLPLPPTNMAKMKRT
jgi:hypothetical protein